jgi:GAF domain-containing protein
MSSVEIAILLTDFPGNLIYHLTVAMALGVILSIAQAFKSRLDDSFSQRWMVLSGSLLAFHLIFLFIDAFVGFDLIKMNNLIATMDRFVSLIALIAFAWLLELPTPKYSRLFIGGGFILAFLGLMASSVILRGGAESGPLNSTGVDIIASFLSLAITLFGAISLVTLRPKRWELLVSPFILMSLGILLHIVNGPKTAYAAGFIRFAEIAAYPLFAALSARALISSQVDIVFEAQELFRSPPALEVTTLMVAISDLTNIFASTDQAQLAQNAVETIAKRMNSDLCLLVIPYEEELTIAAGFDLFQDRHLPRTSIPTQNIPLITDAIQHGKSLIIQKEFSAHELRALKPILSQKIAGPTLFVPLSSGKRVFGGFILISHSTRHLWSNKDRETMERLSTLLYQRFHELKRTDENSELIEEQQKREDLERRIHDLEEEKQHFEDAIEAYRTGEASVPQEDLESLLTMHENDQNQIESLKDEIHRLSTSLEEITQPPETPEFDQILGEHQLALQELAETRQSLIEIEHHPPTHPSSDLKPVPDVKTIIAIAQELRQPMASIQGYTDLLLTESVGLLGAMQQKFLERIRNASERMGDLLNNLIRVSASEVKSLSLTPGPVEILHCLEDAISQVQSKIQKKSITLRMDIPDDHYTVPADEDAITQVFYHLLENAIGASPKGSEVIIVIREQVSEPDNYLMISITDSGEGIPASDLQRVFQRTYSGDKVAIQGISDEGVGISIVKSICENLGGRVWVDSEVGVGSIFSILLPTVKQKETL